MPFDHPDKESEPLPDFSSGSLSPKTEARPSLVDVIDSVATMPTEKGLAYLAATRTSPPSRRARGSQFNGVVRHAGEIMPFVQEAESLSHEHPLMVELDHDRRPKAFYFQPPPIALDYFNAAGKHIRTMYTPDCLVEMLDGRLALAEMKPHTEVVKQHELGNPRFSLDQGNNRFFDKPFTDACVAYGIGTALLTTADINPVYIENLLFLGKGFRTLWAPTEGAMRVVEHVKSVGGARYCDLSLMSGEWTADEIIGSIVHGLVFVDLRNERLSRYGHAVIYASKRYFELATELRNAKAVTTPLTEHHLPKALSDLAKYSKAAEVEAFRRWALIKPVVLEQAAKKSLGVEARKYLKQYRLKEADSGCGFEALIPAFDLRGFKGSHLDPSTEDLLQKFVSDAAANTQPTCEAGTYGALRIACKEQDLLPPSKQTFYIRLKRKKAELASIQSISGDEAKYQQTPASPLSKAAVSRMANRAFSLGLIDHTPLPIRLIEALYGTPLPGITPWLTYLRDAATDMALGMSISWGRPKSASIQSVLWDCYRRYGRIPEALMLDGEKPHDSIIVEVLLGIMRSDKFARRYLRPRDGADVERDFSLLMHGLMCYLQGNYVLRQRPEEWPKGWNPAQTADRTLGSLFSAIRVFLFDHCNTRLARASLGGLTPEQAMAASLRTSGHRGFRVHSDPMQARHIILPYANRPLLHFERQTGVRPFGQRYLPVTPIDPIFYGTQVPVKYDPFDIRSVLALLGGKWTELRHSHAQQFDDLPGDELAAISVEIRGTMERHEKDAPLRAEQLAKTLDSILKAPKDPLDIFLKRVVAVEEPLIILDDVQSVWASARATELQVPRSYTEAAQ